MPFRSAQGLLGTRFGSWHKDGDGGVEYVSMDVVKGVATTGAAVAPSITQPTSRWITLGDGAQMPLWQISISGSSVASPARLFRVGREAGVGSMSGSYVNLLGYTSSNPFVCPSDGYVYAQCAPGANVRVSIGADPGFLSHVFSGVSGVANNTQVVWVRAGMKLYVSGAVSGSPSLSFVGVE